MRKNEKPQPRRQVSYFFPENHRLLLTHTRMNNDLLRAVLAGKVDVVRALIAAGADVECYDSGTGMTPLIYAYDYPEIVTLLLRAGACVHTVSKQPSASFTALYFAAKHGSVQSVRLLLCHGAAQLHSLPCYVPGYLHNPISGIFRKGCAEQPSYKRILRMLVACGILTEIGVVHNSFLAWRLSVTKSELKAAAFDVQRDRMAEICLALQSMQLPALLLVLILREACTATETRLRFSHCWAVATKVKHNDYTTKRHV